MIEIVDSRGTQIKPSYYKAFNAEFYAFGFCFWCLLKLLFYIFFSLEIGVDIQYRPSIYTPWIYNKETYTKMKDMRVYVMYNVIDLFFFEHDLCITQKFIKMLLDWYIVLPLNIIGNEQNADVFTIFSSSRNKKLWQSTRYHEQICS